MGKEANHGRDVYYRRAKEEGFRARSAYKLLQLDGRLRLLEGVQRVVDLCAAPGSWSQVVRQRTAAAAAGEGTGSPRIVAVDLQEMAPLEGVCTLQVDITAPSAVEKILAELRGPADLVICDGAPDVTGLHEIDEWAQAGLLAAAARITCAVLRAGGTFVAKVFVGEWTAELVNTLENDFAEVWLEKPDSSRGASREAFVVCRELRGRNAAAGKALAAEGFRVPQGGREVPNSSE